MLQLYEKPNGLIVPLSFLPKGCHIGNASKRYKWQNDIPSKHNFSNFLVEMMPGANQIEKEMQFMWTEAVKIKWLERIGEFKCGNTFLGQYTGKYSKQ